MTVRSVLPTNSPSSIPKLSTALRPKINMLYGDMSKCHKMLSFLIARPGESD